MQVHNENRRLFLYADVRVEHILENLINVRRMEGIIDYYRVKGASSGEIALAIAEFVKRGEEGLGMQAE